MLIRGAELSFEDLLEEHLKELELYRFSQHNRAHARRVMGLLFHHLRERGIEDVREVAEHHLVTFALEVRGRGLSASTESSYVSSVKRFFRFLDRRCVLLSNPAAGLKVPRVEMLPRFVPTIEQVRRVLEAPDESSVYGLRDRAILEILYGSALRLGECHRLDVSDVDLHQSLLWVRCGKGRKDRLLPLTKAALKALERYLEASRPDLVRHPGEQALFLSRKGERLSSVMIGMVIRAHGKAAGVPDVHPHALRHACATHLLQRGAGLRHVQKLLGHQSIDTTAIYTKVQVEDLRRVVERRHPRERLYRRRSRRAEHRRKR